MNQLPFEQRWAELCARGSASGSIGQSGFGREISFVTVGNPRRVLLLTAGIHAREYPTTEAALAMLDYALPLLDPYGIGLCCVPCVNPDGAALCREGLVSAPENRRAFLRGINGGDDFRLWKANGRAVDLNVNFPAGWGCGAQNVFLPAAENYVGSTPACEPETRALLRFTRRICPVMTLSLHAKGRELYWEFGQKGARCRRDRSLANVAARATGYRRVDGTLGSAGGYKDWCVACLGVPALTVEIGRNEASHPLSDDEIGAELPRIQTLAADLIRALERPVR